MKKYTPSWRLEICIHVFFEKRKKGRILPKKSTCQLVDIVTFDHTMSLRPQHATCLCRYHWERSFSLVGFHTLAFDWPILKSL